MNSRVKVHCPQCNSEMLFTVEQWESLNVWESRREPELLITVRCPNDSMKFQGTVKMDYVALNILMERKKDMESS